PVALVQTFVRSVGVAERVFYPQQQGRGATEKFSERTDEADAATAADADGVAAVAAAKRGHRRFERWAVRVGHPPVAMRAVRLDADLDAPRRVLGQELRDLPLHLLRILIGNNTATDDRQGPRQDLVRCSFD